MVEGEQELTIVEQARMEREKLEEKINEVKNIMKQNQEVESRIILGGKTTAGETIQPPREETPREYKERIMRGGI